MTEFKEKPWTERAAILKPKHLLFRILRVEKLVQTDSYEGGCDLDSSKYIDVDLPNETYTSIVEAFRDLVGDKNIKPEEIGTFDPNIYRDQKGGGAKTVEDNTAKGNYRCTYSRTENSRGRKPSAKEREDFEAGRINLKLADYEIHFNVQVVGLEEGELANLLGVNNW